jgi:hypothetical protein
MTALRISKAKLKEKFGLKLKKFIGSHSNATANNKTRYLTVM